MLKFLICFLIPLSLFAEDKVTVRVGSKIFTESYVLAEIIAQKLEQLPNVTVERKFGLGATGVYLQAIENGEIDVGPEYTGTLAEIFVNNPDYKSIDNLNQLLAPKNMVSSGSLGFNNTYGLATTKKLAKELKIHTISDLKKHPQLRMGLTHEFIKRQAGWESLKNFYGLPQTSVEAMEHNLAYKAVVENQVDFIEVYTTDAKIAELDLQVLKDDLNYFPKYEGVILARADFTKQHPEIWMHLKTLENKITEEKMVELNSLVDLEKRSFADAANKFYGKISIAKTESVLGKATSEHLYLVLVPLLFAVLIGVPLGFMAVRFPGFGKIITTLSSVVQTVPSLALLSFLIPVAGIGTFPALIALFLYSLLPVLLGTIVGLRSIDGKLLETAEALGLSGWKKIESVELPMAMPSVLNGIKTSLVFTIGTATLAALIGAGGYGNLIVTGLAINDMSVVLKGAVPAALMAIVAQVLFSVIEKKFISRGLRFHSRN